MRVTEQTNDLDEILASLPDYLLQKNAGSTSLTFNKRKLLPRLGWLALMLLVVTGIPFYTLYTHRENPASGTIALYFARCMGLGILLGLLPWVVAWLFPAKLTLDHEKQELQTRRSKLPLFEASELIVRDNLLTLSKSPASYQLRLKSAGKRSALLMRSLGKEEAVAIARWLQYETGLPIRVSDKYF